MESAEGIELLLGLGAAADSRNMDQGTALHEASWLGKARAIRALNAHGVDIHARMRWRGGATALHVVASRARGMSPLPARVAARAIKALVEAGANVNEPFGDEAPLGLLTDAGNAAAVWILLETGAEVDRRHPRGGHTALHLASHRNEAVSVVRLLLEAGTDVDARDVDGNTPLHWAASGDSPAAIRIRTDSGADVDARGGQEQRNAVDKALLEGNASHPSPCGDRSRIGPRSNKDFPLYWARTFERAAFQAWKAAVRQRNQQELGQP